MNSHSKRIQNEGDRPDTQRTDAAPRAGGQSAPQRASIKNWAEEDRPREKLLAKGAGALTTAELFAILIGGGVAGRSAVDVMREVLHSCGNRISELNNMKPEELMRFSGIGEARALSIIAAAEVGRRRQMENRNQIMQFTKGTEVMEYMLPIVQALNHEESWALLLNNNSRLIKCAKISSGGLTETSVDVRMIMKEAIVNEATCLIFVHNHPSGSLNPSAYDDKLTKSIAAACETLRIKLLDHVIMTDYDYYSYSEHGRL